MNSSASSGPAARILIADDDDLFRGLVVQNLMDQGLSVAAYADGVSLLAAIPQHSAAQVIVLDWIMPAMTGIEVLREIRARNITTPVIFLTVLGEQAFEEAALLGGAIDFVEKSRSFSILLKRIEVVLNAKKAAENDVDLAAAVIMHGDAKLLLDSRRVFWKEQQVALSLTEFRIVRCLIERAGHDLSYRELYDLVHGEGFAGGYGDVGYRTNVRAIVKRIRQSFKAIDDDFNKIQNYPSFGYRWRNDET